MATRRAAVHLPVDELLIDGEERNPGVTWPLAVDRWLESKLQQAKSAGMATTRKELAAALLTAQEPGDEQLVEMLRNYRRRTVGQLLAVPEGGVVTYLRQPPGPRPRRRRSGT
jgi:hypothetical protein